MELRDFVAESLKQVVDGIVNAQEYSAEKGALINPKGMVNAPNTGLIVTHNLGSGQYPIPRIIEFDVAVTVSEGMEAKAGIGVFAGALGLGTQAKLEDGNLSVSRIRFSIPVLFPEQIAK